MNHEAFIDIPYTIRELINKKGEIVKYEKGEVISSENSPFLYFIISGTINLYWINKENEKKFVIKLQENTGHFGFEIDKEPYLAIIDSEKAILFRITKNEWNGILSYYQEFKKKFIYTLPRGAYLFLEKFEIQPFLIPEKILYSFDQFFFNQGDYILKTGEKFDKFYIIASGAADVTINYLEKNIRELKVGDFFGEKSILEETERTANIIASSNMCIFSLSAENLIHLINSKVGNIINTKFQEKIQTYITTETITMGSSPDCNLILTGNRIAPEHACIIKVKNYTHKEDEYYIQPLNDSLEYKVFVNKIPIRKKKLLNEHDEIFIGNYKIKFNVKNKNIYSEEITHHTLKINNIFYKINNNVICNDISFSAKSGEMICIMGPSGSGKSTLLDLIAGYLIPNSGIILYDNNDLFKHLEYYNEIIGFIPQNDILFPELTVFENLYYSAKIQKPLANKKNLKEKIDNILNIMRLKNKRNTKVGSPEEKILSGGERKRVSIAIQMIFSPDIIFIDEPTSGLSSKDAEDVINVIRDLADMGKILIVVLHQPEIKIFEMFDKIVFIDEGGKVVFKGYTLDSLNYMKTAFKEIMGESIYSNERHPGILFDILEFRDKKTGERVFSPIFWQERFKKLYPQEYAFSTSVLNLTNNFKIIKMTFLENFYQFIFLLQRTFLLKIRNKSNLLTSILVPAFTAMLIAIVLYYIPSSDYKDTILKITDNTIQYSKNKNIANNIIKVLENHKHEVYAREVIQTNILSDLNLSDEQKNLITDACESSYYLYTNSQIQTFIFLAFIVAIFLGLTNSARDIVSEKIIYKYERKLKLKIRWYVLSKFFILSIISAIQSSIFIIIGNFILDIPEVFDIFFLFLFLSSLCGISIGLFLSSMARNSETVLNWIPLILIPQIIFGGALIEYKDMNEKLFFNAAEKSIPEICHLMPSRWAFEGLVVSFATLNKNTKAERKKNEMVNFIISQMNNLENLTKSSDLNIKKQLLKQIDLNIIDKKLPINFYKDPKLCIKASNLLQQKLDITRNDEWIEKKYPLYKYENNDIRKINEVAELKYNSNKEKYEKNKIFLNFVFLSQNKGIILFKKEFEISTILFNSIILIFFVCFSLFLCIASLYIKESKLLIKK